MQNDPINLIDPSGMRLVDMQVNGEYYSEEEFHQKVDKLRSAALKAGNQQEADKLASRAMSFMESGYDYLTPAQKQAYSKAQSQLATASDPEERKRIIREACMSPQELEAQKQQEVPVQAEPTLADYWNAALYNNNRRLNEMLNAPTLTSILNYFSYGALEANAARYEAAQEDQSFYAWGNWATSGYFDSVNGVFTDKPMSLEHWMDSFSAALPVMGLWGYGAKVGSSIVTPKDLIRYGDKFGAVPYGSNLPVGTVDVTAARPSAKGLIGKEFEDYLTKNLGGEGSFKAGGREFDGAYKNVWYEAKSGEYWDMIMESDAKTAKFKSDIGSHAKLAIDNANQGLKMESEQA